MLRLLLLSLVLLGAAACHSGPSATTFGPAIGPRGIEADLRGLGLRIQGELLEVQDSALLVLQRDEVILVALRQIGIGGFRQRGVLIQRGRFVRGRSAAELRLVSRYPQGLTPELRARLLAAHGQTEPRRPVP